MCQNWLLIQSFSQKHLLSTRTDKTHLWRQAGLLGGATAESLVSGFLVWVWLVARVYAVTRPAKWNVPELCILLPFIYTSVFRKWTVTTEQLLNILFELPCSYIQKLLCVGGLGSIILIIKHLLRKKFRLLIICFVLW